MVRRSKRVYTRVGGCPCCQCYGTVCTVTRRGSASAAGRVSDTWFSCDRGATAGPDYDYTRADIYTGGIGDHGDPCLTASDEYAASATTSDVNADPPSTHIRTADINADAHDYGYGYADALGTGYRSQQRDGAAALSLLF
jgi:hypothetical protein